MFGHVSLPSIPYRDGSGGGYWGEQTSTLNFCEEDYVVSYYCAEVFNVVTNLLFLWLGVKGLRNVLRESHGNIFLLSFIGYVTVGLGSIGFHSTLKYPLQLVDELSMIYTTCLMCFATFSYSKSRRYSAVLGVVLMALAVFITVYYHATKNPKFHQDMYGILTSLVVFRGMYIMESTLRPQLRQRQPEREARIMATMWKMVATGLTAFLMGYALWLLDNQYCNHWRYWRRQVMLPWAVFLEGHAWWHLLTGVGAYYYIVWRIWLSKCLDGDELEYAVEWPSVFTSVPEIVKTHHVGPQKQEKGI